MTTKAQEDRARELAETRRLNLRGEELIQITDTVRYIPAPPRRPFFRIRLSRGYGGTPRRDHDARSWPIVVQPPADLARDSSPLLALALPALTGAEEWIDVDESEVLLRVVPGSIYRSDDPDPADG